MKNLYFIIFFISISAFVSCQNLDVKILEKIHTNSSIPCDKIMQCFSNSIVFLSVPITLSYLGYGYFKKDNKILNKGANITVSLVVTGGITYALKYSFKRPRPFVKYPDKFIKKSYGGDYSFPSSHTSNAFALATILSLENPKWYVMLPSFLWAGTIAYSRMHLGVHYPSDVLTGAIIGAGIAYLSYELNKQFFNK